MSAKGKDMEWEDIQPSELIGETAEVYLFQWLSYAEKKIEGMPIPELKSRQVDIEKTLLGIVSCSAASSSSSYSSSPNPNSSNTTTTSEQSPSPGRAIRNLVGRCFVRLYTRAETRTLFDTMQALLRMVGDFTSANPRAESVRIAAFSCIRDIMRVFGSQIMSFMAEITMVTLKTYKSSSTPPLLRYHALLALAASLSSAKRAVMDATMRDVIKAMRNGLGDKGLGVQRGCCAVLIAIYSSPDAHPFTLNELDAIISVSVKSLESADQITRKAHARLVGHLLASTQIERVVPGSSKSAASSKDNNNSNSDRRGSGDDDRLGSGADSGQPAGTGGGAGGGGETKKAMLTPQEMFTHLSVHLNKHNAGRKTRIGIIDFYAALLRALGEGWVEAHFSVIVAHLFSDILVPASHLALVIAAEGSSSGDSTGSGSSGGPANTYRYELLLARRLVGVLLREMVGVRMLSEQGQIQAIQELASGYLKRWPAMMPGQTAPGKEVLVVVLREVAGLVGGLGNVGVGVQTALADPLISLLSHPSHAVRVHAAWALRCFCFSTPLRLPGTLQAVTAKLQRDLSALLVPPPSSSPSSTPTDIARRALGHAYALASLISLIPLRPLYVSYDVPAKLWDLAVQLLKRAGQHDVSVGRVEVEVAWVVIGGLMWLGSGFVRGQLAQLWVLWRNALPKVGSKEFATSGTGGGGRGREEWAFLLSVKECALGAVLCFLRACGSEKGAGAGLVTLDVARRISSLLSNALAFANAFAAAGVDDPVEAQIVAQLQAGSKRGASSSSSANTGTGTLTLRERELLLRRRVHQCFVALGFSGIPESTQLILLQSAVSIFASPEYVGGGSSVQAAIVSSSGSFGGVWTCGDGYGYGVTGREGEVGEGADAGGGGAGTGEGQEDGGVDGLMRKPILGACEHDPLSLLQALPSPSSSSASSGGGGGDTTPTSPYDLVEPPPPSTSVVDTAIELFARLLPLQDAHTTQKVIGQLLENVRSQKLEKNAGRRMAEWDGGWGRGAGGRGVKETFGSAGVTGLLGPFLMDALVDGDLVLRSAASEAIGRLASLSGTNYLTSQIKDLVDQVVNNRNPHGRAGCALAFGAIYSHVGGLAAGPLLKTTVNVLMSLINDPHPVVHFWSLVALVRVIDAASLAYAPFVSSTLGMLMKVYLMESHEREGGASVGNANVSGGFGVYRVACEVVDAVINVLGPDIGESARTRRLVQSLVREFEREGVPPGSVVEYGRGQQIGWEGDGEEEGGVRVEAIKCVQHFLMFAPEHVDIPDVVRRLRVNLSSPASPRQLKLASINALYQLVQKDAVGMSKLGGDKLVEDLFGMLDEDYASGELGVRNVIRSWLGQTGVYNPSAWIDLCQRIMKRTTVGQVGGSGGAGASGGGGLRDDEGESLNVGLSGDGASSSSGANAPSSASRWRTQLFALQCLHEICVLVAASGRKEHVDAIVARNQGVPSEGMLFSRVGDLIRMAFTASTAYVMEIRLAGLVVLRDVIEIFAASPDPAYDDALLLEQHQAPITAALTPAFSSDSTPEILASAVDACAVFVGCGVVKDVGRMGRILKLLIGGLEQSKDSGTLSLGESGQLSPNASAMLRISTLAAWAQLQVSSTQPGRTYLEEVVRPYRPTLCVLWIAALRDYASVRIDSEFLVDSSSASGSGGGQGVDSGYVSLGKEVLLPYYAKAWPVILQAVATAMQAGDKHILAAMDGKELPVEDDKKKEEEELVPAAAPSAAPRTEQTAFFFIIFGLVYEALATSSSSSSTASSNDPSGASSSAAPSSQSSLSSRKNRVLAALRALKCLVKPEYSGGAITAEPTIFEEFVGLCYRIGMTETPDVQAELVGVLVEFASSTSSSQEEDVLSLTSPRAHCLRICAHVLKQALGSSRASSSQGQLQDRINLISSCLTAFTSIASGINSSQREDVRAVAIVLYGDLLKDESSEIDLVSPTLPALKALLSLPPAPGSEDKERYSGLIHALLSATLLNIDAMRGRSGAISAKKTKNNMLAAVLILTVVPAWVKVGQAVIEHACFLISQKLVEGDDISLTAAHCSKTLILASTSGQNGMLRQCARLLIPGLIEFVAKMAPLVHDGTIKDLQSAAIAEVWKGFAALFGWVTEENRPRLLGVFLPTISLLLSPSPPPSASSHPVAASVTNQTVAQLLSFASASPSAFKEAIAKLDEGTRELLELSIRRALGAGAGGAGGVGGVGAGHQAAAKPQISLRSF
ncbi:hypothetical protein D9613_008980 [Agrocybe pediades]|uniref:LAA1-like C-terminal TPR repeats domain-containing protein n=1 Tax=Agrocybe pediades TaxID=84607 RepID=A0A8H4VW34_9AGAR|nr:hypothetical protein D9613_008980 [Agrocybe pediades]